MKEGYSKGNRRVKEEEREKEVKMRDNVFTCNNCGVEFMIKVEPNYSDEEVEKEFPNSLEWLKKVRYCPVCQEGLEIW